MLSGLDKKQKNIPWANEEQPTFIFPSTNKSFDIEHNLIIEKSALKFKEWQNHRNWLFSYFYHDMTEGLRTQNHFVKWLLLNYVTS